MSDYVIDASVAVKWFVVETDSLLADEVFASGHRLFAPRLILTEVANVLSRKVMAGLFSANEACGYIRSLPLYLDKTFAVDDLIEPALQNACVLRHPIYDLIYLEAARQLNAKVLTADRRFTSKLPGTDLARYVTLLSDWQPA